MEIGTDLVDGLGIALNEAAWTHVEHLVPECTVEAELEVLTLPESGPEPSDRRRILRLTGVSRIAASYRRGRWDDPLAQAVPLELTDLNEVIERFGRLPIYGWEFIDLGDAHFRRWRDRLSLDIRLDASGTHTVDVFQENGVEILDYRVWFAGLEVLDGEGLRIPTEAFVAGGVRWWDALYARDGRTGGHGIVPG